MAQEGGVAVRQCRLLWPFQDLLQGGLGAAHLYLRQRNHLAVIGDLNVGGLLPGHEGGPGGMGTASGRTSTFQGLLRGTL